MLFLNLKKLSNQNNQVIIKNKKRKLNHKIKTVNQFLIKNNTLNNKSIKILKRKRKSRKSNGKSFIKIKLKNPKISKVHPIGLMLPNISKNKLKIRKNKRAVLLLQF
jgi:type VI protein secretion system component Hcp